MTAHRLGPGAAAHTARSPSRRRPPPGIVPPAALRQVNFWTISIPFAIGLAAQVGFLTHQIAYLEPRLGHHGAGLAVCLTTMAAIIGRLITGIFIDRVNRRLVSSVNFIMQAIALGAMITWPTDLPLYLACVGVGLTLAFEPGVLGVIRDVTGSYTPSLLLCILVHSLAAGMVLLRHRVNAPDPLPTLASTPRLPRCGSLRQSLGHCPT